MRRCPKCAGLALPEQRNLALGAPSVITAQSPLIEWSHCAPSAFEGAELSGRTPGIVHALGVVGERVVAPLGGGGAPRSPPGSAPLPLCATVHPL